MRRHYTGGHSIPPSDIQMSEPETVKKRAPDNPPRVNFNSYAPTICASDPLFATKAKVRATVNKQSPLLFSVYVGITRDMCSILTLIIV